MFSSRHDLTFHPDRIVVTDDRTGRTVDRTASRPFSSPHRLIADRAEAAALLRAVLTESNGRQRSFTLWPTVDVRIVEGPDPAADAEDVRRLLSEAGFAKIRFR